MSLGDKGCGESTSSTGSGATGVALGYKLGGRFIHPKLRLQGTYNFILPVLLTILRYRRETLCIGVCVWGLGEDDDGN